MFTQQQEKALSTAYEATATAYNAHNLGFPPEDIPEQLYGITFIDVIGEAFAPEQFRPVKYVTESQPNQKYFESVQSTIRKSANHPSNETRELGKAYGHWLAILFDVGAIKKPAGLKMEGEHVVTDSLKVPCGLQNGNVVEYGMGVSGLLSHVANLRRPDTNEYQFMHIGNNQLENIVLDSMANYYGVGGLFTARHQGISAMVADLAQNNAYAGRVDAIIASRVHAAEDLTVGIEYARRDLLRAGGVLALRGPRYDRQGTGYDDAAQAVIESFGAEAVIINEQYESIRATGDTEPGRTIIARNLGNG